MMAGTVVPGEPEPDYRETITQEFPVYGECTFFAFRDNETGVEGVTLVGCAEEHRMFQSIEETTQATRKEVAEVHGEIRGVHEEITGLRVEFRNEFKNLRDGLGSVERDVDRLRSQLTVGDGE